MPHASALDPVTAFIEELAADLREDAAQGQTPPIERRRLRTVLRACRKKGTQRALEDLSLRLARAGLYAEPHLADTGLRSNDWVLFSTGPFPADAAFFPREQDLQRFVEACIGSGVFRNLEACKLPGRRSGREFRLPDGRRIDLLCQERGKSGPGALVVVELKRDHQRGTVEQVIGYIDALRLLYPSRAVRGIIVSGREDRVASTRLREVTGYDIRWLCYHVAFAEWSAASSATPPATTV